MSRHGADPGRLIDVSIVLPTYNERDNICDLVDAIACQLRPTPLALRSAGRR